jgi:hypothetical protein
MATEMAKRNINETNDTHVSKAAGFTLKRFKLSKEANGKVFGYRRILSAKWAKDQKPEPAWEDALEELLRSHPALKNIKPDSN